MKLLNLLLTDAAADTTAAVTETVEAVTEAASSGGFGEAMNSTLSIGERITLGLQVTGLGLGTVFVILAILWGILTIFRIVFYDIPNGKKAAPKAEKPAPAPAVVESEPELAPLAYSEPDDAELVAAITAAVSMMMDAPQTSFRVVSFRRTASK